ncbi:Rieske (2Fe-2S) protein [Spirosoma knui]
METILPKVDQPTMPRQEFFRLVGISLGAILITRCAAGCGAQGDGNITPDPNQKIDFMLRLDDKSNENLIVKGGYVIVNNVIVAQTKDGNYVAVSADCTHQGTQLTFKPNDNQFYCPLHLSRFDTTGKVITGPAVEPLTQYKTSYDSGTRTIRVFN